MKRCWIGEGILVLILVLGLISGAYLRNFCREAGENLAQAAREEAPQEQIEAVYRSWERNRTLLAMLCDHSTLEEMEEHFRILDPEQENFREVCLRLAAKFEALGRSQSLSWANVF